MGISQAAAAAALLLLLAASAASALPTAATSAAAKAAAASTPSSPTPDASATTPTPLDASSSPAAAPADVEENVINNGDSTSTEIIQSIVTPPVDHIIRDTINGSFKAVKKHTPKGDPDLFIRQRYFENPKSEQFHFNQHGTADEIEDAVRSRNKQRRIQEIKGYIYNTTRPGKNGAVGADIGVLKHIKLEELVSLIQDKTTSSDIPQKFTSFHPDCEAKNTKKVEAAKSSNMFMMFNLTFRDPMPGHELLIVSAKLRLFKMALAEAEDAVVCKDQQAAAPHFSSVETTTSTSTKATPTTTTTSTSSATASSTTTVPTVASSYPETKVVNYRVTIYYLVRNPENNKEQPFILDCQMIPLHGESIVEFNVSKAVQEWRNAKNNLGLFVQVEDPLGKLVPASSFFREMNCTTDGGSRAIPSVLFDAALAKDNHTAHLRLLENVHPLISLCTSEVPVGKNDTTSDRFYILTDSAIKEFRAFAVRTAQEQALEAREKAEREEARKHKLSYKHAPSSMAEDEKVSDMQMHSPEEEEHHQRHHRHHHHHNNNHELQELLREEDLLGKEVRKMATLALGQKGRDLHNLFHSGSHRKAGANDRDHQSQVEVIILPVVLEKSKVAEMDEEIQEMDQQPIAIDKLFQR